MTTNIDSLEWRYRFTGVLMWTCCLLQTGAVVGSFMVSPGKGFFALSMGLGQFVLLRIVRTRMARQLTVAREAETP